MARARRKIILDSEDENGSDAVENDVKDAVDVDDVSAGDASPAASESLFNSDPPSDKNEDDYVDDEDDDEIPTRKRRVRNSLDFELEDDMSDDDEFVRKLSDRQFIATDDEEEGDYEYGHKPQRQKRSRSRSIDTVPHKRGRPRTRTAEPEEHRSSEEEEEAEEDINQELAALYDSSPDPEPVKHKLRERAKIDYTIPPPITSEMQLELAAPITPSFKGKRGRPSSSQSQYRNLLFPTAGPFGGSDVVSVFGKNIPSNNVAINNDSDSSDDEIVPVNGKNDTNVIGASTSKHQHAKKNTLSDTDPLGVDMNIDFSAVGGLDEYINQLKEMVALPLLYPELYQNFAITPPRGVLFHGPPGTGKTLMARALASSFSTQSRKITFFMRKGADCLSKWVGEAERQLRLLFEEAKNQQPSIIFFDEIDGLAPVRSSKQEQIHASIVSTLLALMDGMDNRGQVIVIGATNRPDAIDPALRRPGRFDREFYFPLPDAKARKQILSIHTKKWTPPLADSFLGKIAGLTKGYGGADLRALCTEAALNSIQRKYPQIYQTNQKLQVVPSKVRVIAKDFMNAMDKIVPSSARSTSSGSAPLPQHLECLLRPQYDEILGKLAHLLPNLIKSKNTLLEEALYLDPSVHDEDGGFARQEFLKNLESSRVCKPSLLISGEAGSGQQYLGAAILNHLEGFQVQSLDVGAIFSDLTRTPELAIIQTFIEARRHQPSVIFIPNIDIWFQIMPLSAKATLLSLLRSLKSNEKILLLGISETLQDALDHEIRLLFASTNDTNNVSLHFPDVQQRRQYFGVLEKTLLMKPFEFINDLENRPKRKLKQLKVLEQPVDENVDKKKGRQQEYEDTKLKNVLKIKLAVLMDLFKTRYKRFKKPIIDENLLSHIFFPQILENPISNYEVLYEKATDEEHKDMIKELSTGKYYYNIDLDIIEERLWNGYYSEPKQFLKDIKMIVHDSVTSGDRERILKANEMLTNAQFGIDDISTPDFLKSCREMRQRELARQEKILAEMKEEEKKQAENLQKQIEDKNENEQESNENGNEVASNENENEKEHQNGQSENGNGPAENGNGPAETEPVENKTEVETEAVDTAVEVAETKVVQFEDVQSPGKEQQNGLAHHSSEPPADSESESEAEIDIDKSKELVVPEHKELFSSRVIEITSNCNIEKLEIVMARLMDIIWTDRSQWDKSSTIQKLHEAMDRIENELN